MWFTAASPSAGSSLWVKWTNDSVGSVVRSCSDTHVNARGLEAEKVESVRLWLLAHSSPLGALHGTLLFSIQARLFSAFSVKSKLPQGIQNQTLPTSPALTLTIPPLLNHMAPPRPERYSHLQVFSERFFLFFLCVCLTALISYPFLLSPANLSLPILPNL